MNSPSASRSVRGEKRVRDCYSGKKTVNKIYSKECGVKMRLNNDSVSYLRNPVLSPVWVCLCVCETVACKAEESLKVS